MISKETEAITASKKTLSAAKNAWQLQKQEYANGHQAKAEGKPVVWSCALVPKELYWAMDVVPFFPEQFASLFSTRRLEGSRDPSVPTYAVKYCQLAEAEGFKDYICGYARTWVGYVLDGLKTEWGEDLPLGGPPQPDMMISTSYACDVRMKGMEYVAQKLKIPMFTLDFPEIASDMPSLSRGVRQPIIAPRSTRKPGASEFMINTWTDYDLEYTISQFEEFFDFIEQVSGNKFDVDKLNEALEWSYRTCEVNREINELRKAVPAPMPSTDGFASAYPRLYLMGTERGYNYFAALRDELKENVSKGIGALADEKFRLAWYGLPTWFNMGIFNYFEKFGGVFVWEPSYNTGLLPPRRPEDPVKELALRCLQGIGDLAGNTCIGGGVAGLVEECRQYKIDGVVLSYLITCRPIVFPATEISKALEEELGIPTVALEADLVDERIFAESQAFTRLDAFGEQLLRKGSVAHVQ
ncbi:2-hydroxyacyl-CoA dehydratase subunit D [Thermodesulfobacteriota bacterium]